MLSDDPTIAALGEARGRARTAVAAGRPGGLLDPRAAIDDYKAALADCPLDQPTMERTREELVVRLVKGMAMAGTDVVVGQLFATLMTRLEAVEDVLSPDASRRRIARWELRLADAHLAARAGGEGA